MSCPQRFLVIAATVLALGALGIGLTTLLHERWMYITSPVKAHNNTMHYEYYSRWRGLIWICLEDKQAAVFQLKASEVVYGNCFGEDLGQSQPNANFDYWYIIHLRRSQLGAKAASLLVNVIGLLLGFATLLQWCLHSKSGSSVYRRCRGVMVAAWTTAALLALGAMVIYHLVLDLEKYLRVSDLPRIYANWPVSLQHGTNFRFDLMYYLEWGAVGLLLCAALAQIMSLCLFPESPKLGRASSRAGTNDDRTYLYHSNPMMQMSSESLPPYDAYRTGTGATTGTGTGQGLGPGPQDDGQSARSGQSSRRLPRYPADGYDNQAKNVYRIY